MAKARRQELRNEELAWHRATELGEQETFAQFILDYPDGKYSKSAKLMIDVLAPDVSDKPPLQDRPAFPESWTNASGMEFAFIPEGTFQMGVSSYRSVIDDPLSESEYDDSLMGVRVTKAFYLGKHEVTQAQWVAVMGSNPSEFKECGPNCPVENVNWNDVQKFIQVLNQSEEGNPYRLPPKPNGNMRLEQEWCKRGMEAWMT